MGQLVKNLPAMWETWVGSLGWEDPPEKGMPTHSSILAWRIPWTIVHGLTKSQTWLSDFHFNIYICFSGTLLHFQWSNGCSHEFEQVPGVGGGQESLACCSPWGRKEMDMTEWLNWTELWSHLEIRVDFWSPYTVGIKKIISVTLLPNMFKHHIQGN